MAKFATYEEMVEAAGSKYAAKATSDALADGLAPYAPAGQTVRTGIRQAYDHKVRRVAEDFRSLWGNIWRNAVFGAR
jgi:hypothetical protein